MKLIDYYKDGGSLMFYIKTTLAALCFIVPICVLFADKSQLMLLLKIFGSVTFALFVCAAVVLTEKLITAALLWALRDIPDYDTGCNTCEFPTRHNAMHVKNCPSYAYLPSGLVGYYVDGDCPKQPRQHHENLERRS